MINLALIGRGKWGSNYLKEVKKIPNCKIKYIKTTDFKDLLQYKDVDGIIIATPDNTHVKIIKYFPDKFLLVEKPVVTNLQDVERILNPRLMAGHLYIYNKRLMGLLEGKKGIEKIVFTILNTSRERNTSLLWYLSPHPVSLFIYLYGIPKDIKVSKLGGIIFATFIYNNLICRFVIGWNFDEKKRLIKIIRKGKTIEFKDDEQQKISPLENQLLHFIDFIKGKKVSTDLEHTKKVISVIDKIEKTFNTTCLL